MNSDPIIAAIEAHRRACAVTRVAFEHQNAIEDELGAEAESDRRWIAANDAAEKALVVQDDLAVNLLECQPATIDGAAALLTYYVDVVTTTRPDVVFPVLDGKFVPESIDEPRRDFSYFIMRNVAAALKNIMLAHFSVAVLACGEWSGCPSLP
jgi:hypothetical protein